MYYYSKLLFEIENAEKEAAKAAKAVAEPKPKKQAVFLDQNKDFRDEDAVPLEFIKEVNFLAEYDNRMVIDAVKMVGWSRVRKSYRSNTILDDEYFYVKPKWRHLKTADEVILNCTKGEDYLTTDYFTEKSLVAHMRSVVPKKRLAYLETHK